MIFDRNEKKEVIALLIDDGGIASIRTGQYKLH
jgi:hypothetical protein